jgi:hypothetical protein
LDGTTIYTLRPCKWVGQDSFETAWSASVMPDGQHLTPQAELLANARLIAAAPELVEALEAQERATTYAAELAELSADGTRLTEQHMAKGRELINIAKELRRSALSRIRGDAA